MRFSLIAVGLIMLTSLPLAIAAEKWEALGKHPLGMMYLDRGSVQNKKGLVTYWVKRIYPKEYKSPQGFKYNEQRLLHEINCKKRTVSFIGMRFFKNGKLVAAAAPFREGPSPIKPEGFVTKEAAKVCPK